MSGSCIHGTIVPMKEASIQRIVAGQAVTDLASAVKELVDNALDSGATTINIRLFNQGMDIIEVSDDGCGVPMTSRPFMAQKHATSKITSFEDIYNQKTTTLGFRGEALFCLANLSANLVVVTRTVDEPLGQKLEFTRDGSLLTDKVFLMPRKVGTTVAVVQLFDALPVRRADFCKRIQAQRTKVFSLMQGYAILCLGVKFNLMDCKGDREEVKLRTASSADKVENNISSVLGSRFLAGMCRLDIDLTEAIGTASNVSGLISNSPGASMQALARDLQFFSVNNRPVELPKVSRLLNELWRNCDPAQRKRPACVLQFTLPPTAFDVNLSPDKRDVMITDQDAMCELIRNHVQKLWENQSDGSFDNAQVRPLQAAANSATADPRKRQVQRRMAFVHDFATAKLQHNVENDNLPETGTDFTHPNKPTDLEHHQWSEVQRTVRANVAPVTPDEALSVPWNIPNVRVGSGNSDRQSSLKDFAFSRLETKQTSKARDASNSTSQGKTILNRSADVASRGASYSETELDIRKRLDRLRKGLSIDGESTDAPAPKRLRRNDSPPPPKPANILLDIDNKMDESTEGSEDDAPDEVTWVSFDGTDAATNAAHSARLVECQFRANLKLHKVGRSESSTDIIQVCQDVTTVQPDAKKLTVRLSKTDFGDMKVVGQFNMGFIVCKSNKDHQLWILDQHACDEKYNFEALCRDTKFQEQRLIQPMPLELSPSEESCILENRDVFETNGFRFIYNENERPRHRLSLVTLPHSGARDGCKAVQFGKEDVSALCAILGADGVSYSQDGGTGVDGSGLYGNNAVRRYANGLSLNGERLMARLPKAIAMFANRACRGSIMIGTALSQNEMETIVDRLKDVDQPWNCPHGRPTMRHVVDLVPLMLNDEHRLEAQIAGPSFSVMSQSCSTQALDEGSV